MYNKKSLYLMIFMFCLISISLVSAVKPITSITSDTGLIVEPTEKSAIRYNIDHAFEVHVFNKSNGMPITSGITCYMHLYHSSGEHIYEGIQDTANHDFDYGFDLTSGNFTNRGEYQAKFQCNNSEIGGGSQLFFIVNDFGEELSMAHSFKFNMAMFFMLVFFMMAIAGCIFSEHYIAKFVFYWVAHLIFIAGNFSIWQFNMGYTSYFTGMASVWKIMFYLGIYSVVPMVILSMAWIFYIHTFNEHFQKLVDKGEDPETAFSMAKKKSGGWSNGK